MIVMFQGTNEANNDVAGAVGIAAVMSAAKYNRKTLLIQMTDAHFSNVENMLIGKKKEETEIRLETLRLEDKGIDALVRRAETKKLTKDHFDRACEPLLKYANMLDSATITQKEDFEINITVSDVRVILKCARDVYDNVFILLNGQNTTIMQEMLELADCIVTCFSQSPKKEVFNTFPDKRALKVITDYDSTSAYNAMYLKKMYKDKKVYLIPHNSGYRDAYLAGTLLQYILKNMNNTPEDVNFLFIKHVTELMDGIMGKENWSEEIPEPVALEENENLEEALQQPLETISEDDYEVMEIEKKQGLFGKMKRTKVITLTDSNEPTNSEEESEEEIYMEEESELESEFEDEDEEEYEEYEQEYEEFEEEESESDVEEVYEDDESQYKSVSVKGINKESGKRNKMQQPHSQSKPKGLFNKKQAPKTSVNVDTDTVAGESEEEAEVKMQPKKSQSKSPVQPRMKTVPLPLSSAGTDRKKQMNMNKKKEAPVSKTLTETWICPECGEENIGKFCGDCGTERPEPVVEIPADSDEWICPECGEENTKKFCANCGCKKPLPVSKNWFCPECGTENTKKFCPECGYKR